MNIMAFLSSYQSISNNFYSSMIPVGMAQYLYTIETSKGLSLILMGLAIRRGAMVKYPKTKTDKKKPSC